MWYTFIYIIIPDSGKQDRHHELRHSNPEAKKLMAEYIATYGQWGEIVSRDFFKCTNAVFTKTFHEIDNKPIEDIAEIIQKYYNMFSSRLHDFQAYDKIDHDIKDQMLDFFEKFIMVSSYR